MAARFPTAWLDELYARADIVSIVSGYLQLKKDGRRYWGLCPFHNEKTPSFSVSGPKQMYHCFGCGVSGNVYTFVMQYENYSFQEAIKHLAQKAGVSLPEAEYTEEMKKRESKRSRLLEVNKEAAKYFFYQLRSDKGEGGYSYLKKPY